jgi:hypothetical protein
LPSPIPSIDPFTDEEEEGKEEEEEDEDDEEEEGDEVFDVCDESGVVNEDKDIVVGNFVSLSFFIC